jgi:hypothetical protein
MSDHQQVTCCPRPQHVSRPDTPRGAPNGDARSERGCPFGDPGRGSRSTVAGRVTAARTRRAGVPHIRGPCARPRVDGGDGSGGGCRTCVMTAKSESVRWMGWLKSCRGEHGRVSEALPLRPRRPAAANRPTARPCGQRKGPARGVIELCVCSVCVRAVLEAAGADQLLDLGAQLVEAQDAGAVRVHHLEGVGRASGRPAHGAAALRPNPPQLQSSERGESQQHQHATGWGCVGEPKRGGGGGGAHPEQDFQAVGEVLVL